MNMQELKALAENASGWIAVNLRYVLKLIAFVEAQDNWDDHIHGSKFIFEDCDDCAAKIAARKG